MLQRILDYAFLLSLFVWWAGSIGQALNFAVLDRLEGRDLRLAHVRAVLRRFDRTLLLPGIVGAGALFVAELWHRPFEPFLVASFATTWLLNMLSGTYFHPRIYASVEASSTGDGPEYKAAMRSHAIEGVLAFVSGFAFLWMFVRWS